jgi:hypothetical protein
LAGITLAQAEAQLAAYLAAETAALNGQSYRIGDRMLTRADLSEIRAGVDAWNARVTSLAAASAGAGRGRARTVVAR